jgi:hypothetical protein
LTGIDGAATTTLALHDGHPPMDRPLPDVLATLEAEYFVEWQVADISPLVRYVEPSSG